MPPKRSVPTVDDRAPATKRKADEDIQDGNTDRNLPNFIVVVPSKKANTQTGPAEPVKVERKVKNDYAKFYRETGGAYLKKKELFEQVVAEENMCVLVPHFRTFSY